MTEQTDLRKNVDVGVVHFIPLIKPKIQLPFKIVEKVVKNVFQFRRKHCYRGLEMLFPEQQRKEMTAELLRVAGVNSQKRPFELCMADFRALAIAYNKFCIENPALYQYDFREDLSLKNYNRKQGIDLSSLKTNLKAGDGSAESQTFHK
ncbi:hypothetical protein DNTS_030466 [Danionella cerebrum]|uniref:Dimethyladenosine transferase 1, mitochondrial n=1 Tax=Danionella cerebrum TaxID=2873325 RepID=A0A553MM07_9TELE|nr:hypothetical protein DNTS_030466 [Danionella translucida]